MTAILDTGPLAAFAHRRDKEHERAIQVMKSVLSGTYGTVISLDLVLLEGLTLLQNWTSDKRISELYASYFHGASGKRDPILKMRSSADLIEQAVEIHFQYHERKLSTVDAALIAITQITGGVLVTFDGGFEGIVPVVSE